MKAIPRPLMILVIVIVVLGVISCGAAGLKGEPDPSDASWDFKPEGIHASEVRAGDGCTVEGNTITVSSACTLVIHAQPFPPRELRLRVLAGMPEVRIVQEVGDYSEPNTETFGQGETFGVSAAVGKDEIEIGVSCISIPPTTPCTLEVLDD